MAIANSQHTSFEENTNSVNTNSVPMKGQILVIG